jgi:hypothetical protein
VRAGAEAPIFFRALDAALKAPLFHDGICACGGGWSGGGGCGAPQAGIEVDADWLRVGILRLRLFFALFAQRTILAQDDNLN